MLPDPILELFRRQHGALADWQLRGLEPDKNARRAVYRHPDIDRETGRVVRHRAVPPSIEQTLMLSVLDAGPHAALWSKSAASHCGFTRFRRLPAHVAVPRRRLKGDHLGQVHVIGSLDPADIITHLDIPTSRPELTVLWLAGMYTHRYGHEIALERTAKELDQAWRQRLIDGAAIHDLAERSGGRGRSGIVVLRELLEDRPVDYQPAGSALEERFEEIIPSRVAAALRRQITVDAEVVIRTVDFLLEKWPLIVEVNGEAFHSSLVDQENDNERYERLIELGFSVVVFWEHDLWHDAGTVWSAMQQLFDHPDPTPRLHRPTRPPWAL